MANIPRPHFEDFEPVSELKSEKERDTLILHLPGFKKEQLRVQLTSTRFLRISGETSIGDNRWKHFRKDYQLPSNIDLEKISSKFSDGILYVYQPKLQTPELTKKDQPEKTAEEAVKPKVVQEQPSELQPQMPKGHELGSGSQPQILQQEASSEGKKSEKKDNTKDEEKKDEVKKEVQLRPENLRRIAVYVVVLLIMLGFVSTKMFRSFTNKVVEQSVMGYDHQEL